MGPYFVQNDEVIARTATHHGFTGDTFWWKIDRKYRIVTDELTGRIYTVPEDVSLGSS